MTQTIHIKNMVCNRCVTMVRQLFDNHYFDVESIVLGQVNIRESKKSNYLKLEADLKENGFEVIKGESETLIEKIKIRLIQKIEKHQMNDILLLLAKEFGKTYSTLSRLFSKSEGITLEKYLINLKIEKVKEHIQLKQLNFSEIAHSLNYNNSSHLAKQFKSVTSMSMSQYKKLQDWNRKGLDQIV